MSCTGIVTSKRVPASEDILREKTFKESAEEFSKLLKEVSSIHIPLVLHPGQRVKSKKEMREIEEKKVETRKEQKVRRDKKDTRKERRKKTQVEEKLKIAMKEAKDKKDQKKNLKKVRPGKLRRENASSFKNNRKYPDRKRSDNREKRH